MYRDISSEEFQTKIRWKDKAAIITKSDDWFRPPKKSNHIFITLSSLTTFETTFSIQLLLNKAFISNLCYYIRGKKKLFSYSLDELIYR